MPGLWKPRTNHGDGCQIGTALICFQAALDLTRLHSLFIQWFLLLFAVLRKCYYNYCSEASIILADFSLFAQPIRLKACSVLFLQFLLFDKIYETKKRKKKLSNQNKQENEQKMPGLLAETHKENVVKGFCQKAYLIFTSIWQFEFMSNILFWS